MDIQRRIQRGILRHQFPHDAAMAYRFSRSPLINAQRHLDKDIVVRLDIVEFFPSVNFNQVLNEYTRLGYENDVAVKLAILSTAPPFHASPLDGRRALLERRRMPQGAPTSPLISNLVCFPIDHLLSNSLRPAVYTRYADDMFFSWNESGNSLDVQQILGATQRTLYQFGFRMNRAKIQVMRRGQRQIVTGISVNGTTARVPREYIRNLRALLHQIETVGLELASISIDQHALGRAVGMLGYIQSVNARQAEKILSAHPWLDM